MYRLYRTVAQSAKYLYFGILDYSYVLQSFLNRSAIATGADDADKNFHPEKQVVLIPGIYETWRIMKPVVAALEQKSYRVHVIKSIGFNSRPIDEMAQRIEKYAATNQLFRYSIVAHSKGGLIAKRLLDDNPATIERIVTINTPFSGSPYAKFVPLRSIRVFMPESGPLKSLAKLVESNSKITSIYSAFDPHIPSGSYLPGADNRRLNVYGHFRILKDNTVHLAVLQGLGWYDIDA